MLSFQFLNRNISTLFIPLIFILTFNSQLLAQTPYLKHFTIENGLPSSNVYTSYQDSLGVMWFGTDKGIVRFNGYTFESFNMSVVNASTDIWGIIGDQDGRLWFSSQKQLTYLDDNKFKAISFPKDKSHTMIERQYIDDKNNHFIHFQRANKLYQIDKKLNKIIPFNAITIENIGYRIIFLKEDKEGQKWFLKTIDKRIILLGYKNNKITEYGRMKVESNPQLRSLNPIQIQEDIFMLLMDKSHIKVDLSKKSMLPLEDTLAYDFSIINNHRITNNLILLNTNKGYRVIDKQLRLQKNLSFLNQFLINDLSEDQQGNIWICTRNDGIYFLPKRGRESQTLATNGNLIKDDITALAQDKQGRIWFANKNLELKILKTNKTVHTTEFILENPTKANTYIDDLAFDASGNLYIGANEDLFMAIPKNNVEDLLRKKKISIYQETLELDPNLQRTVDKKPIIALKIPVIKSFNIVGNKLYSTSSGVTSEVYFTEENLCMKRLSIGRAYASAFWQEKLWIGRKDKLFTLDLNRKNAINQPFELFPYSINALKVCKQNKLWIATDGKGLFRYDTNQIDTIHQFFDTRITIKSIFFDNENQLWIATNKGLGIVKILQEKPFKYSFRMITKAYGLISDGVNAVIKNEDNIYVATSKGLTILDEKKINFDNQNVPLFFTKLLVNANEMALKPKLTFAAQKNNLRIEYLCLSYSNMGDIVYDYKMEGIDKRWQKTTAIFKEYPTLPSGKYVFKIRARNMNGTITGITVLDITIRLPWWRTWWALVAMVLMIVGIGYLIFKYQINREKERNEQQQLKELSALKSRFYANITHEFRTPLTLIMGLTQRLKTNATKSNKDIHSVIERHSHRLLSLINQLLDLSKLEANAMPINYQKSDIVIFINYIVGLFEPVAVNQQIQLTFYKEIDSLIMDFDADKMQSIVFNLLSNAIKFTEAGGQVIVHLKKQDNTFILKVKDTGIGISNDALALIFNRFYQGDNHKKQSYNTGIGLALVKELVEEMKGGIAVESSEEGTTFTIDLPIYQIESSEGLMPQKDLKPLVEVYFPTPKVQLLDHKLNTEHEKPLLLLVEDDLDLMQYLQSIIGQYYKIETAKDGAEGIEIAIEKVPDLIISDIMMPNKNGFELCQTLKKDERTSHIPIILLTAKAAKKDEIKGLKAGADVYMIKPFHQEELFIRINQLLETRQQLQTRYQSITLPKIKPTPQIQKEDAFIQKVRAVIEEHIDNYQLDVSFLCEKLYISRAQLHKKITYLTGHSTTKFVKKVRLEKAEKLLKETELNIAEIAYETGFEAKYFSKVFAQTYGCSPTKYRKQLVS